MYLSVKAHNKESFINFYNYFNRKEKNEDQIKFDEFNYSDELRITFYQNLTILFNGKINDEIKLKLKDLVDKNLYIGIDEVGVGEPIGPIIACGFKFLNLEKKEEAIFLNIKDSKNLDLKQISSISNKLNNFGNSYCVIIEPNKFNDIWKNKIKNIKAINAIIQNQIILKMNKKNSEKVVIDKFVNEEKYFEYLDKYTKDKYNDKIIFETKAENKYLEVAAASIIAKNKYNDWIIDYLKKEKIDFSIKKRINTNVLINDIRKNIEKSKYNDILKEWKK